VAERPKPHRRRGSASTNPKRRKRPKQAIAAERAAPTGGGLAPGTVRQEADVPRALDGERLDRALAALIPDLSRTRARKVLAMGGVFLGQERVRVASRVVRAGDHLTATWHAAVQHADRFPLRVLYEDEAILVLHKPAGQLVQGTELGDVGSLTYALARRFGPEVRLMHRLDRGTSGVMVAARDRAASGVLTPQFREHTIERVYWAVTEGVPPAGRCELPLVRTKRRVRVADPSAGERAAMSARTDVRVLAHHPDPTRGLALVEATLHTGRTHQVRVHLAALGAPIVGDDAYGRRLPAHERAGRLCLHAVRLGLDHPRTGERLVFQEAPEADFWEAAGFPARDLPSRPAREGGSGSEGGG